MYILPPSSLRSSAHLRVVPLAWTRLKRGAGALVDSVGVASQSAPTALCCVFGGPAQALEEAGIKPGDMVVIGKVQLEWSSSTESDLMQGWQKAGGSAVGSKHWPMAGRLGA